MADGRKAFDDRVPQHQAQRHKRQDGESIDDGDRGVVLESAPYVAVHAAIRACVDRTSKRAIRLTVSVTRISTSPSSISAAGYRLPVASENSLAILLASVYPGEKIEGGISSRLPMTMVTAMVSPSARPRASTVAPKIPARAAGSNTRHVVSHQVAPRATDDSRSPRGTARITSRETAESVGRIMMASTREAVKMLAWRDRKS